MTKLLSPSIGGQIPEPLPFHLYSNKIVRDSFKRWMKHQFSRTKTSHKTHYQVIFYASRVDKNTPSGRFLCITHFLQQVLYIDDDVHTLQSIIKWHTTWAFVSGHFQTLNSNVHSEKTIDYCLRAGPTLSALYTFLSPIIRSHILRPSCTIWLSFNYPYRDDKTLFQACFAGLFSSLEVNSIADIDKSIEKKNLFDSIFHV